MAHDGPPASPVDHSTTAETPWQRRESRGPGAGERSFGSHRSPAAARPAPPPVASSRAPRPAAQARVTEGARDHRDAWPVHALVRASLAALPAAPHPTSDMIRGHTEHTDLGDEDGHGDAESAAQNDHRRELWTRQRRADLTRRGECQPEGSATIGACRVGDEKRCRWDDPPRPARRRASYTWISMFPRLGASKLPKNSRFERRFQC